jgi:hypothetical protein
MLSESFERGSDEEIDIGNPDSRAFWRRGS